MDFLKSVRESQVTQIVEMRTFNGVCITLFTYVCVVTALPTLRFETFPGNNIETELEDNWMGFHPQSRLENSLEVFAEDEEFADSEEGNEVPGEPLTPADFAYAEQMTPLAWAPSAGEQDPIETAGLFEGDIAGVNASNLLELQEGRNAVRDLQRRWSRGIVPYVISASFGVFERGVIAGAVLAVQRASCVRLVPRTRQRDYVFLQRGAGCSSAVGRLGGAQPISLGAGCALRGVVIHELLHALGFWHEQSRPDRDKHITVLWRNVQPGMEHNFQKFGWNAIQTQGFPYDIGSVMHYGMYAFSKDRRSPTIIPNSPGVDLVGQRNGFSKSDILKLNKLYECEGQEPYPTKPVHPPSKPHVCSDNSRFCGYWARIGECKKNPAWMLVNCPVSCSECGSCSNYNKNCFAWADRGECLKNPSYMTIYCAEACHTCKKDNWQILGCEDHNKYCHAWALDGQCQINPSYMLKYCMKSCKQCKQFV